MSIVLNRLNETLLGGYRRGQKSIIIEQQVDSFCKRVCGGWRTHQIVSLTVFPLTVISFDLKSTPIVGPCAMRGRERVLESARLDVAVVLAVLAGGG